MFIVLVLLFLVGVSSFIAGTFTHFLDLNPLPWQLAAFATVVLFVGTIVVSFRRQHFLLRALGTLTAVAVGFFNFALMASLLCWLVLAVAHLAGWGAPLPAIALGLYALAAAVTFYGLVNAATLRVTRYDVALAGLPAEWEGRVVALVSDLHVGNIRGPGFIQQVVARLKALDPAAVFISGDMFDGASVDIARSVEPWRDLRTMAGTYFVTGNHDEFMDRAPYLAALTQVGVRVLHNEKVVVEGLQIVGMHDGETHRAALFREILEGLNLDPATASILLAHQPRHLEVPESAGLSLQLSGHTHLGQSWPVSLIVRRIFGPFAYGLNRFRNLQVVTSSGAGSWGPPMRVGSRSEIVLIRLRAATA